MGETEDHGSSTWMDGPQFPAPSLHLRSHLDLNLLPSVHQQTGVLPHGRLPLPSCTEPSFPIPSHISVHSVPTASLNINQSS